MHESWHFDGFERVRPADGPQDGTNDVCHIYSRWTSAGRLIAAAPHLLAALEAASQWGNDFPDDVSDLVAAAIAKARGV